MNTNKIREALRIAKARIMHLAPGSTDYIDDALAELDKAPKALTEEVIDALVKEVRFKSEWAEISACSAILYARYNGYLAPAVGLTVDEVMEVYNKWRFSPVPKETLEDEWNDLRSRLAAAMEAKTRKP